MIIVTGVSLPVFIAIMLIRAVISSGRAAEQKRIANLQRVLDSRRPPLPEPRYTRTEFLALYAVEEALR